MKVNNEPSTNKLLIYEFLKAFSLIFIEMDESFIHLSFKFHSTKKKKKKNRNKNIEGNSNSFNSK